MTRYRLLGRAGLPSIDRKNLLGAKVLSAYVNGVNVLARRRASGAVPSVATAYGKLGQPDGTNYWNLDNTGLFRDMTRPVTIAYLYKPASAVAYAGMLRLSGATGSNAFCILRSTDSNYSFTAGYASGNLPTVNVGAPTVGVEERSVLTCAGGMQSNTAGDYVVYINGLGYALGFPISFTAQSNNSSYLGWDGADSVTNGVLDEFVIFDGVLSAIEIAAYNANPWQIFEVRRRVVAKGGATPPVTATTSLSAAIELARTATASINAAVQVDRNTSASIDSAVSQALTAQASIGLAVQQALAATTSLQTAVQADRAATASVDAAVQAVTTAAASLDVAAQLARSAVTSLSAQVQAETNVGLSFDLAVQSGTSVLFGIDIAVLAQAQAAAAIDAALQLPRTGQASLDAMLLSASSAAVSLDIALQAVAGVNAAAGTAVQEARTAAAGVQAAVSAARSAGAEIGAAIAEQRTATAAIAAAVLGSALITAGLSAYVLDVDVQPLGRSAGRVLQQGDGRPVAVAATRRPAALSTRRR